MTLHASRPISMQLAAYKRAASRPISTCKRYEQRVSDTFARKFKQYGLLMALRCIVSITAGGVTDANRGANKDHVCRHSVAAPVSVPG